jgi:hypothetical protein
MVEEEIITEEHFPIYTEQSSYSQYNNILLIDENVVDHVKFINGVNSSTFPIIYGIFRRTCSALDK